MAEVITAGITADGYPLMLECGRAREPSQAYIRSIIDAPNPEHETWVAPSIWRAKS